MTAKNLGLHIAPLLENWGDALKKYCSLEMCWLVLWTRPDVFPDTLRKTALTERNATMRTAPTAVGCQHIARANIIIEGALHDVRTDFLTGAPKTRL